MKYAASVSHEEATVQEFKNNPQEAAAYLSAVLEDGDHKEVVLALNRITTAFGAAKAKLDRAPVFVKPMQD